MEKLSSIVMGLIIVTAIGLGMGTFFTGTAVTYQNDSAELQEFIQTYDSSTDLNTYLQNALTAMTNFNPLNPLTWGNFVSTIINVILVFINLPAFIHGLAVSTLTAIGMPGWTAGIIELVVLSVIIFAGLSTLNKYKV